MFLPWLTTTTTLHFLPHPRFSFLVPTENGDLARRSNSHPNLSGLASSSLEKSTSPSEGFTPPPLAASSDHSPLLQRKDLQAAADDVRVRSVSFRQHTLFADAQSNNLEDCVAVLQEGQDVNQELTSTKMRPLHVAATCGSFEVATQLLNAGAEMNAK